MNFSNSTTPNVKKCGTKIKLKPKKVKEKVFRAMTLRSFKTSPRKNKNEHNTFREITRRGGKENRNSAGENGERTRALPMFFRERDLTLMEKI